MSSDGGININGVTVNGGANIIGKNEGGMHNHFDSKADVGTGDIFDAIEKSLPDEEADRLIEEVIDPLEALANKPPAEQTDDVKAEATTLIERLTPYAPQITKTLVTLGEAGLTALATSNPIISILVASLRAAKDMLTES